MDQVSDRSTLQTILQDKQAKPVKISFSLLKEITGNFSENKIGDGGYGEVYKGVLGDGFVVAVKKLKSLATIDEEKFEREVAHLAAVKHRNIVRFIGYCAHTHHQHVEHKGKLVSAEVRERLLCLDYMPKGSLDSYRRDTDESHRFLWHQCYEIIKGICWGLHHLHEKRVTHLDLKPDNILLDNDMVPKITDFGLSRLLGEDKSRTKTGHPAGTPGYMAPEYYRSGNITFKADIFSLGAIIRRMVAGGLHGPERSIENVAESWRRRTDGRTPWEALYNQVKTCIELSNLCTVDEPTNRPGIEDIIRRLDHHSTANGVNIAQQLQVQPPITLPSRSLSIEWSQNPQYWRWRPFQESRFQECAELDNVHFLAISGEIQTQQLSPNTGYTVYLVYRLGSDSSGFHAGQTASIRLHGSRTLTTSPVSLDREARGLPEGTTYPYPNARGGDWMELKLAEFGPNDARLKNERSVIVDIRDENCDYKKTGLIVEAMEFRPNTYG